jgi:hypothetical protein
MTKGNNKVFWRRVKWYIATRVSEELSGTIFRVIRIDRKDGGRRICTRIVSTFISQWLRSTNIDPEGGFSQPLQQSVNIYEATRRHISEAFTFQRKARRTSHLTYILCSQACNLTILEVPWKTFTESPYYRRVVWMLTFGLLEGSWNENNASASNGRHCCCNSACISPPLNSAPTRN